jgi:hypothetical protein
VGTVALAALAAFSATNVDDFLVLVVFFAQVDGKTFTNYQVAAGQTLGFSVILAVSLLGIVLGLFIPSGYIELLGFVPILIGLRQLYELVAPHCSRKSAATASSEQCPESGDQAAVPTASGELTTLCSICFYATMWLNAQPRISADRCTGGATDTGAAAAAVNNAEGATDEQAVAVAEDSAVAKVLSVIFAQSKSALSLSQMALTT